MQCTYAQHGIAVSAVSCSNLLHSFVSIFAEALAEPQEASATLLQHLQLSFWEGLSRSKCLQGSGIIMNSQQPDQFSKEAEALCTQNTSNEIVPGGTHICRPYNETVCALLDASSCALASF